MGSAGAALFYARHLAGKTLNGWRKFNFVTINLIAKGLRLASINLSYNPPTAFLYRTKATKKLYTLVR